MNFKGGFFLKLGLVITFFSLVFFLPKPSLAYSYSPLVEKVDAEVRVNVDGSIKVSQDITFVSSSNYLYWIIPSDKVENINIRQANQITLPTKIERDSSRTVILWQNKNDSFYQKTVSSISYRLPANVELRAGQEFVKLVYLNKPGQNIENINLKVIYPDSFNKLSQRYYAVHGVGLVEPDQSTNSSFSYEINDFSEFGIFTLDMIVPQGTFELSLWDRLRLKIGSLSLQTVLLISFLLPLIALFFLFSLYRNHVYTKDISASPGRETHPPSNISPMELDVLRRGKLTKKGIGATLIKLLNEGYLTIVDKPKGVVLGKIKETDQALSQEEKILIKILFKRKELKGGLSQIEERKKKSVFDELTSKLFKAVSKKTSKKDFFVSDSSKIKNRVLKQAIVIFFSAVFLALFLLLFFPASPWLSIAPLSMILISLIIIRLRHFFTVRSIQGQEELAKWLKFKNYLEGDYPVKSASRSIFLGYLPWAYLFDVDQSWTSKFNRYPLARPQWFTGLDHSEIVDEQISRALDFIDKVASEIVGLKSPLA